MKTIGCAGVAVLAFAAQAVELAMTRDGVAVKCDAPKTAFTVGWPLMTGGGDRKAKVTKLADREAELEYASGTKWTVRLDEKGAVTMVPNGPRGAADKGLSAPGDYLTRALPPVQDAPRQTDLGGRKVQILHVPGHTPGSLMLYLPDEKLLLTGDNWNPTTWLWYPEAEGAAAYLRGMRRVTELPFERALCSHRSGLYPRSAVTDFLSGLTAACLEKASPVELGREMGIDTRECSPAPEQVFVFDADKVKGSDLQ